MDHKHTLHVLKDCSPCVRKAILKTSSPKLVQTLCEVCLNVLNGNINLSQPQKLKLKKYKNTIRELAGTKKSISKKRKILVQKGGFISLILSTVLGGLVNKLLSET